MRNNNNNRNNNNGGNNNGNNRGGRNDREDEDDNNVEEEIDSRGFYENNKAKKRKIIEKTIQVVKGVKESSKKHVDVDIKGKLYYYMERKREENFLMTFVNNERKVIEVFNTLIEFIFEVANAPRNEEFSLPINNMLFDKDDFLNVKSVVDNLVLRNNKNLLKLTLKRNKSVVAGNGKLVEMRGRRMVKFFNLERLIHDLKVRNIKVHVTSVVKMDKRLIDEMIRDERSAQRKRDKVSRAKREEVEMNDNDDEEEEEENNGASTESDEENYEERQDNDSDNYYQQGGSDDNDNDSSSSSSSGSSSSSSSEDDSHRYKRFRNEEMNRMEEEKRRMEEEKKRNAIPDLQTLLSGRSNPSGLNALNRQSGNRNVTNMIPDLQFLLNRDKANANRDKLDNNAIEVNEFTLPVNDGGREERGEVLMEEEGGEDDDLFFAQMEGTDEWNNPFNNSFNNGNNNSFNNGNKNGSNNGNKNGNKNGSNNNGNNNNGNNNGNNNWNNNGNNNGNNNWNNRLNNNGNNNGSNNGNNNGNNRFQDRNVLDLTLPLIDLTTPTLIDSSQDYSNVVIPSKEFPMLLKPLREERVIPKIESLKPLSTQSNLVRRSEGIPSLNVDSLSLPFAIFSSSEIRIEPPRSLETREGKRLTLFSVGDNHELLYMDENRFLYNIPMHHLNTLINKKRFGF